MILESTKPSELPVLVLESMPLEELMPPGVISGVMLGEGLGVVCPLLPGLAQIIAPPRQREAINNFFLSHVIFPNLRLWFADPSRLSLPGLAEGAGTNSGSQLLRERRSGQLSKSAQNARRRFA